MKFLEITDKNRPKGVSLLIAIIFVSLLLLVSGSLAQTQWKILRERRDWDKFYRTQELAFSIANLAWGLAASHDAGWNTKGKCAYSAASGGFTTDSCDLNIKNTITEFMKGWYNNCTDALGAKKICVDYRIKYEVIGRPTLDTQLTALGSTYFAIPAPRKDANGNIQGTGTVSSTCKHNVDGNAGDDPADADNPCHWNVLGISDEPHQIPLFYDDGTSIKNPADTGLTKFMVRVRPRCPRKTDKNNQEIPGVYAEWCQQNERYIIYPGQSSIGNGGVTIDKLKGRVSTMANDDDDVIAHWQITGTDKTTGESYTLQEYQHTYKDNQDNSLEKRKFLKIIAGETQGNDTTITASRINNAKNIDNYFVIKDIEGDPNNIYYGKDNWNFGGRILDFLKNGKPIVPRLGQGLRADKNWFYDRDNLRPVRIIHKPYLWLEMINRARKSDWNVGQTNSSFFIPSVEYQILTDKSIADSKQYIRAEMTIDKTTRLYVIEKPIERLTQSFTIQN